jgi:L-threonylcarbamoyladenylate synthase
MPRQQAQTSMAIKTLHLRIQPNQTDENDPAIQQCAEIIKRGGLVAMPTETVYGLAADALRPGAVEGIFKAKERPSWDPLIVHISSLTMVPQIAAEFPPMARDLAKHFWPGPLTLVLKKFGGLPREVNAGRDNVAVRFPLHPVARALISACGVPLAAPSANRFGHTSPTTAEHVLRDLDGRIDAVLDAGPTTIGVESTVLDPLHTPPLLLRPGGVTRDQIESVIGPIELYVAPVDGKAQELPSPGLAGRHYAPEAQLVLVAGTSEELTSAVSHHVQIEAASGHYVGVMAPDGWIDQQMLSAGGLVIFDWGQWSDIQQLAHNLFAGLRYLDKPGVSTIICPLPPDQGLGTTIRDRLTRAARPN